MSSAADEATLPPQLIFQGKTSRSLPSGPTVRELHHDEGWRFKYTQNHWSTLGTTKEWVEENLLPYYKKVRHIRTNQLASDFNHLPGNSSQLGASDLDQTSCIRFESDNLLHQIQVEPDKLNQAWIIFASDSNQTCIILESNLQETGSEVALQTRSEVASDCKRSCFRLEADLHQTGSKVAICLT